MEEKQGNITEIIFHNEENGYTIAIMETEKELFTIVGNLSNCIIGAAYKIKGTFRVHHTYGEQFVFTEFEEVLPTSVKSIEGFLASGIIKGIGPKTAKAVVNVFGENTLKIIEEDPMKLTVVTGIGEKKAGEIGSSFKSHREFAKVSMFFQEYGISTDYALKLYKFYGASAVDLIKENPYRMVEEISGIGFRKADIIAEKMGIERDSDDRIRSGIKYGMWFFTNEGNTYMPKAELAEKVSQLLDVSIVRIEEIMIEMAFEGEVKIDFLQNQEIVYLFAYFKAEQKVCANINRISTGSVKGLTVDIENLIRQKEENTGITLSEQQKHAVKNILLSGMAVITGGPGTGKTTVINTIISIFEESGFKVAIAAPTGRAAKRITETSGHYASTIHRLLEYYYSDEIDAMKFGKNSEDPLDYDVVIIDEASMIDLLLMEGLTDAIKEKTRLILVGDYDQLPSVGAGNVLRDIIESEYVQTVMLKEIFRQAEESLIVVNAHRINHGEYPFLNEREKDFFFMERSSEKEIAQLLVQLVTDRLAKYYEGIVPTRDIQVLTPTRKGLLGSVALNQRLQEALNPHRPDLEEKKFGDKLFRENDKVMQIKNNYQLGWKRKRDFMEGQGVFNGDVGFIEKIDKENGSVTVIYDEDRYAFYEFGQLDELELAYAVTVHKSQGSEFPIVVIPISWFPPMLATRNLLYTAVTRGKDLVVLVGMERRMNEMIDNNRIKMRYSGLRERLKNLLMVKGE